MLLKYPWYDLQKAVTDKVLHVSQDIFCYSGIPTLRLLTFSDCVCIAICSLHKMGVPLYWQSQLTQSKAPSISR